MKKQTNKRSMQKDPAETVERRALAKRNSPNPLVTETQKSESSGSGLARIRRAAKADKRLRFTNLLHHLTPRLLEEAYQRLNKKAAVGVDGQSWKQYGERLEDKLADLHKRLQSNQYKPKPVKRKWIAKSDGSQRPLGITCIEDKVVQQALVWVLQSIYETDFKGFSYGFRPGRGQHQALDAVYVALTQKKVSWVLDADIEKFFDQVDHTWLLKMLDHRIGDRRVQRIIDLTLRAGVSDQGQIQKSHKGVPQGAVISPLLGNIVLHYALDLWVDQWRKRHARGEIYIVRYADDFILGCQKAHDAHVLRQQLVQRLSQFGLTLHPTKTRLIEFGRFAKQNRAERGLGKPESFDFLGFTHLCAERGSDHGFMVRRKTNVKRQRASLALVKQWLRQHRHLSIEQQGKKLRSYLLGVRNYYGVPGNKTSMDAYRTEVCRGWKRALNRRSHKARINWSRMKKIIDFWIPSMSAVHPYPNQRLIV